MKIVRREIERSGRAIHVAWIDTEGLDLGFDTISSGIEPPQPEPEFIAVREMDKRNNNNDDDDDINPDLIEEELEPVLADGEILNLDNIYFCIDTYKKLATGSIETCDALLRPANGFLRDGLSQGDAKELCLFYIDCRKIIDEELILLRGNLSEVSIKIGNNLYDLAQKIDLPEKLIYYCKNYGIPMPDLSKAGTRVGQDREEMTFREPEYYQIMAISILCKLLCPIWGDLTYRTIKHIDTMQKETHCTGVIVPILNMEPFRAVSDKLYNYIANIVDKAISSSFANASFTATIGGFSKNRFHQSVHAMLLVKRYVNVDLYTPDGNLMVWTSTCAKQSFDSLIGTLNSKCHVMKRVDISDGPDRGDEESNVSVLEHGSRVTTVTADVPVLIKYGVQQAIKRICREYQISDIDLKPALVYYHQNPIQVTPINKILVGVLLGNKIGGAKSLKYLDHLEYTRLVAITQIYVANHIHSSLVHLLTATIPALIDPTEENQKRSASTIDTRINMLFNISGEYKDCETAFNHVDNSSIGTILLKVKDHITKFNHFANTAPNVSAIMEQDPLPKGSLVEYDEMVMRHFCSMILQIIGREKHNYKGL